VIDNLKREQFFFTIKIVRENKKEREKEGCIEASKWKEYVIWVFQCTRAIF
jgi:hypothetical protein